MSCGFARREVLEQFFGGDLDAGTAGTLADHLEGGCPACEAMLSLMGHDHIGELLAARSARLQVATAAELGSEEQEAPARPSDELFGAIMAEIRPTPTPTPRRRPLLAWAAPVAFAAMAAIALVVIAPWSTVDDPGTTMRPKGNVQAPVELTLWFETLDGDTPVRGVEGATYPSSTRLLLHVALSAPSPVALYLREGEGHAELVYASSEAIAAGDHVLQDGAGGILVYSLDGHAGKVSFYAVPAGDGEPPETLAADALPDPDGPRAIELMVSP